LRLDLRGRDRVPAPFVELQLDHFGLLARQQVARHFLLFLALDQHGDSPLDARGGVVLVLLAALALVNHRHPQILPSGQRSLGNAENLGQIPLADDFCHRIESPQVGSLIKVHNFNAFALNGSVFWKNRLQDP
jgi:hypothetical protein